MSKLVIVESPAKAKTISQYLGREYDVHASFGHVRDLPESAAEIPEAFKKEKWANLGVNVEKDFEPIYVISSNKKRYVDELKRAAKGATELLLATDEDREGESISWHVLQIIKPAKKVPVRRIVFHEITPEAIRAAVANPRDLDEDLVKAQEARRILDRLYGYTLSPLLWKKVRPKLSAGRVQSVAVRLCVMRERERMAFHDAEYWDLLAKLKAKDGSFEATLNSVSGQRVATGRNFDPATGLLADNSLHLIKASAEALAESAKEAKPWRVLKVESKPGLEQPPKPFQTSSLQQEASRKLRYSGKRTMQIAQALYEGIDLQGERVGLITYMRTDSLTLAERALGQCRDVIRDLYGSEYLPHKAVQYKTKSKGAQEAHEAIRPTDLTRLPQDVRRFLTDEQYALYELIWKRTIACQMVAAKVLRTTVDVGVHVGDAELVFGASGRTIEFPGFLRAYVEGTDDPELELESQERTLPAMKVGDVLDLQKLDAKSHKTQPPARYTEASLIKKLEEEGIGRPSTYVSILSTIQDRGYIFKKGNELIPTFTAFAVTTLLEDHFRDLVDTTFTAKMEDELDEIADGDRDATAYLKKFYKGDAKQPGLNVQVEQKGPDVPYPVIPLGEDPNSGQPINIRIGRFGAYLQRGEGGDGNTANVPDDFPPANLDLESALALFDGKKAASEAYAVDEGTGRNVYLRSGRFGTYLELEQTPEEAASKEKPKRASLPPGMKAEDLTPEDVPLLMSFPRTLGKGPDGTEVQIWIGRYGPFAKCGEELRNIEDWRHAAEITLEEALKLIAQPKPVRGRAAATAKPSALRVLTGEAGELKVMSGRYGPYVTDGKTNATLPKSTSPEDIDYVEAKALIEAREAKGPAQKRRKFTKFKKK